MTTGGSRDDTSITVCGGGNGAHALIGKCLLNDVVERATVYLPIDDERERFARALSNHSNFLVERSGSTYKVASTRIAVTGDPEEAARSSVIVMVVPAFAHGVLLGQLAPYVRQDSVVAALPARSGFEYEAGYFLGSGDSLKCSVAGFQTLPWACRIQEFGHSVGIYGTKKQIGAALMGNNTATDFVSVFADVLGMEVVPYSSMLELSLANVGQIIHPGIMYGVFKEHYGTIFASKDRIPPFYRSVDEEIAEVLSTISDEILAIRSAAEEQGDGTTMEYVVHLSQWLAESYEDEIKDSSSLARMFQTNQGYQTLKVPVKKTCEGYEVDASARYLTEDVPFGLLVTKGVGSVLGVETPTIDEVIETTSKWMGKEYLVEGKLAGQDIAATRVPQRFGIDSFSGLLGLINKASPGGG